MATINYPSQILTSIGTTVKVRMLPLGTRILPTYTITADTPASITLTPAASASSGATTITFTSLPVTIPLGTSLTFGAVTTTTTEKAYQGATSIKVTALSAGITTSDTASYTPNGNGSGDTQVVIEPSPTYIDAGEVLVFGAVSVTVTDRVKPNDIVMLTTALTGAVSGNATTQALLNVVGATDASPSSAPKTTDTTNYLSGAGVEMATIGTNRTLNVSFNEIEGDLGGAILKLILFNDDYYNREVYAVVQRPNGEKYEGAAILTTGDGQAPVQEKLTRTANMQFQGASFIYTPSDDSDVETILSLS